MFYKFNLTCFLLIVAASLSAQTKIGGDPFVINDGSILELEDTERGVLFPRIVLDDVSQWTLLGSPVDGMVIVNEGGAEPEGVYHWNDGAWHSLSGMTSETVTTIVDNLDGTFTYTNAASLNVFRNGARVGFTILGTTSIQLEAAAVCYANDEIRIVQYSN